MSRGAAKQVPTPIASHSPDWPERESSSSAGRQPSATRQGAHKVGSEKRGRETQWGNLGEWIPAHARTFSKIQSEIRARASSLYSASTTLRRPLSPQHEKPVVAQVRKPDPRFLSQHSINSPSSKLLQTCGTRLTTDPSRMSSTKKPTGKTQRSAIADVVAREYTIHLHKRVNTPETTELWEGR